MLINCTFAVSLRVIIVNKTYFLWTYYKIISSNWTWKLVHCCHHRHRALTLEAELYLMALFDL